MMNFTIKFAIHLPLLLTQLCLVTYSPIAAATEIDEDITVVYLGPDHPGFWHKTKLFASEVAQDLNMTLQFRGANDRFAKLAAMKALLKAENKPDYLIFGYTKNVGAQMMTLAEEANVPFILINADIPEPERELIGYPRGKYTRWLAHMYPDDEVAGYLLSDFLIEKAKQIALTRGELIDEHHPLKVVGVGGPSNDHPAILRNQGIRRSIDSGQNTKLLRIASTSWHGSHYAVTTMFKSYAGVHVVWAASDRLAIETSEAANSLGYVQGESFVTGGIDWSPAGLDAVANGKISVSFGGHLMEAGWALVLIHDYHHKLDFKDEMGSVINTQFTAATQHNIEALQSLLSDNNWRKIDYRQFSKVHNSNIERYKFNAEEMQRLYKNRETSLEKHTISLPNHQTALDKKS